MNKQKFSLNEEATSIPTVLDNTSYVEKSGFIFLSKWLAYKNGTYYLNSDLLYKEVISKNGLTMTSDQTNGVMQILKAVIKQNPDAGEEPTYRFKLILNGSGTESGLIATKKFVRNNHGNTWKSVDPTPDPVPDLKVSNTKISIEAKAYGSIDKMKKFVEGKPAQNFYWADFVCCRLITSKPQKWFWYKLQNNRYTSCSHPQFLEQELTIQPKICHVTLTANQCFQITVQ